MNLTSLRNLKVNQLRSVLDECGADSRGTKETLVQRLLTMSSSEQQQQDEQQSAALARAAAAVKEG